MRRPVRRMAIRMILWMMRYILKFLVWLKILLALWICRMINTMVKLLKKLVKSKNKIKIMQFNKIQKKKTNLNQIKNKKVLKQTMLHKHKLNVVKDTTTKKKKWKKLMCLGMKNKKHAKTEYTLKKTKIVQNQRKSLLLPQLQIYNKRYFWTKEAIC